MKTFDGSYTFLFVITITLDLFETMDTAQICVNVPDVGRVCVPDPTSELNSDFGNAGINNCPTGMVNIRGICFRDPAELLLKSSSNFFDISDFGREKNGYFEIERGIEITEENNLPEGQGKMGNGCLSLDPRDCRPEDFQGPRGGSAGIGAPCPAGTRADKNGHCRQALF